MSFDRHIQEKIYRLETLKKYQAYYGPNTPYQIVVQINQLEAELRRMLQADVTRRTQKIYQAVQPVSPAKAKSIKPKKKKKQAKSVFMGLSRATVDLIATVSFIGFVFLLGAIVFAAYLQSQSDDDNAALAMNVEALPTLRPTFTSTPDPNNPQGNVVEGAESNDSILPPSIKVATDIATPVPTLTPSDPTATPTPIPTETPLPTSTRRPPPPAPTATAVPPTSTPAPEFPFSVTEQGNRMFQKTSYHNITIYVGITTQDNVPIGDLKIVGDHSPSGKHVESGLSDWHWSSSNCLDCNYAKFGNVKFEPGTFTDGVWNVYVADNRGIQISPVVPLTYSAEPEQWVWDFLLFRKLPGL